MISSGKGEGGGWKAFGKLFSGEGRKSGVDNLKYGKELKGRRGRIVRKEESKRKSLIKISAALTGTVVHHPTTTCTQRTPHPKFR